MANDNLKILIPLIRKAMPNLIAADLIGVQPMSIEVFTPWAPWFAWRPVVLRSGAKVWMKNIYRRAPYGIFGLRYVGWKFHWQKLIRPGKFYHYDNDFGILKE